MSIYHRGCLPHKRLLRPLIGCRPRMGGSAEQTSYIRQDPRARQSVAATPVTGSLVCISWFNLRDTEGTVFSPQQGTSGDTDRINGIPSVVANKCGRLQDGRGYFGITMGHYRGSGGCFSGRRRDSA